MTIPAEKAIGYSKKLRRIWSAGSEGKTDPTGNLDDPDTPDAHFIPAVGCARS